MIQRIQSAFLFLAALCLSVIFMFPVVELNVRDTPLPMYVTGFPPESLYNAVVQKYWFLLFSLLLIAVITLLLVALFSYKRRPRQIKLCSLSFFLTIIFLVLLCFLPDVIAARIEPGIGKDAAKIVKLQWPVILPVLSLVLNFLAVRFIRKDEALVRSADRLR